MLPLQRVEMMWRLIFFSRLVQKRRAAAIWITRNADEGMNLSGRSFIELILYMAREEPQSPIFPWKLGSQTVEEYFRTLRMPYSRFSSQVCFSVSECRRRAAAVSYANWLWCRNAGKIALAIHDKTSELEVSPTFAHSGGHCSGILCSGITEAQIEEALLRARGDAERSLASLGVPLDREVTTDRAPDVPEDDESDAEDAAVLEDRADDEEEGAEAADEITVTDAFVGTPRDVAVPWGGRMRKDHILKALVDRKAASSDRRRRVMSMAK
jgi:hypothetical protein